MLVPFDMNSPEAFMSQLSKDEQSCISETGDPRHLLMLMSGPGPGSPQDVQDAQESVRCLGEETLLRLFLTGLIGQDRAAERRYVLLRPPRIPGL